MKTRFAEIVRFLSISASARTLLLLFALGFTLPAVLQAQFIYTVNSGAITITGYTGPGGSVSIPGTIDGLPVTSIGDGAFVNCTNLASVAMADTVTNIGGSAFGGCTRLTSATIGNSVVSIGGGAFALTCLGSIAIPDSVTTMGQGVFLYCPCLARA
ncbi:MAG TPA: leucine-rich repeat domain-containing protein, partial [Verrucomicrobiae bacterium]